MKVRSLRDGDTPEKRAVLTADTAPTPDPAVDELGFHTQGADFLHVYIELDGFSAAQITPWYYSTIAEQWFEGDSIGFDTSNKFALLPIDGEERVFFVLDSATGAGTVRVWAGNSFRGRDL